MADDALLTPSEEEILVSIGYLVIRWNCVERCARQILRKNSAGDLMDDPKEPELPQLRAIEIETKLGNIALPNWQGPGRKHLERLIGACAVAREYRNHFVRGIYATADTGGPYPAQAVLLPPTLKNDKSQLPSYVGASDLCAIANHVHNLAMFAREVLMCFDERGERALKHDGSPVLEQLPALIVALPPCNYQIM